MRSVNRTYLPEVDHLRAFAAILILLYHGLQLIGSPLVHGRNFDHSIPWPQPSNPISILIVEGHSAVSLFIVLSGFILTIGMLDKTVDYLRFMVARILRIYPMLLLCLMLAVATRGSDVLEFLNSALPIDPRNTIPSPFTAMFWAVKVELQCYLLFPALLWLMWRQGPQALLAVIGLAVAFRILAVLGAEANPRELSYWTLAGRIDQFTIGMLAAHYFKHWKLERISPWWLAPALVLIVTILLIFNRLGGWPTQSFWRVLFPPIEGAAWALVILCYVSTGRLLKGAVGSTLAGLGAISYSSYLLHSVVISAVVMNGWAVELTGRGDWDALLTTLIIVFPVVTLLAAMTYQLIEKPFMKMRPRYATVRSMTGNADRVVASKTDP